MTASTYLHGVALANYRGIGDEVTYVGPFQRFNFFIGPNNVGKSTVLNYIARHLRPLVSNPSTERQGAAVSLIDLDKNISNPNGAVTMGIGLNIADAHKRVDETLPAGRFSGVAKKLLAEFEHDGMLWFQRSSERSKPLEAIGNRKIDGPAFCKIVGDASVHGLWNTLTGQQGGGSEQWLREITPRVLSILSTNIPEVALIPAIREVSAKGQTFADWSGRGLIEELGRHQDPDYNEQQKRIKFNAINEFLKAVTDSSSAEIRIPHDRGHILVWMDAKLLPLSALGTGIHEVVMLAASCTILQEQIVCIEEPEIHLHPLLQRRLIQYLGEHTSNQYFIATHSASIIDATDAAVFHVSSHSGQTSVAAALTLSSRFQVCRDLGYRASDLLQSNAIIWVEGPSDRIYLKHWIEALAPDLREGIDFSVMFYGGRLLSHLSASDEEGEKDVQALIAVRHLNRNLCVVLDSDKGRPEDSINATKLRILSELGSGEGVGWVTDGREIENYVSKDLMTTALKTVYGERFGARLKVGQFDHVLPFKRPDGKKFDKVDKVAVASAVCAEPAQLDVLDLRLRVEKVVALIRAAGHWPASSVV